MESIIKETFARPKITGFMFEVFDIKQIKKIAKETAQSIEDLRKIGSLKHY